MKLHPVALAAAMLAAGVSIAAAASNEADAGAHRVAAYETRALREAVAQAEPTAGSIVSWARCPTRPARSSA
jgi:hypothetical protein